MQLNETTAEQPGSSRACVYCAKEFSENAEACPYCGHPVEGRAKPEPSKPLRPRHKVPLSLWFAAIWLFLIAGSSLMVVVSFVVYWSKFPPSIGMLTKWLATTGFFAFLAIGILRGWKPAYRLLSGWGTVALIGLSLLSGGVERLIAGLLFLGPVLLCVNTHSAREFFATRSMKKF